eukprot:4090562-Alexandrium_andersonii.AAC.1
MSASCARVRPPVAKQLAPAQLHREACQVATAVSQGRMTRTYIEVWWTSASARCARAWSPEHS